MKSPDFAEKESKFSPSNPPPLELLEEMSKDANMMRLDTLTEELEIMQVRLQTLCDRVLGIISGEQV
jgi:hypothetical protein